MTARWLVGVLSIQDAIDTDQTLYFLSCSCLKRQQTTGPDFLNVYLCQCGQFAGSETVCRHLLDYVPLVSGIPQNNAANQIPADRLLLPRKPDARVPPIVDLYGFHQSIAAQLLETRTMLEHILSNQIIFSKPFLRRQTKKCLLAWKDMTGVTGFCVAIFSLHPTFRLLPAITTPATPPLQHLKASPVAIAAALLPHRAAHKASRLRHRAGALKRFEKADPTLSD